MSFCMWWWKRFDHIQFMCRRTCHIQLVGTSSLSRYWMERVWFLVGDKRERNKVPECYSCLLPKALALALRRALLLTVHTCASGLHPLLGTVSKSLPALLFRIKGIIFAGVMTCLVSHILLLIFTAQQVLHCDWSSGWRFHFFASFFCPSLQIIQSKRSTRWHTFCLEKTVLDNGIYLFIYLRRHLKLRGITAVSLRCRLQK